MPIVYHYTTEEAWKKAKSEGILIPSTSPLRPGQGGDLPKQAYQKTILAFLEQMPKEWINNKDFPGIWHDALINLTKGLDVILVSFKTKNDEAYVLDKGELEKKQYEDAELEAVSHEDMCKACLNYFNSKTGIEQYKGGFVLPEVRLWNPIEIKRIKREWQKSLAEVIQELKR